MRPYVSITGHSGIKIKLDLATKNMERGWKKGMQEAAEYLKKKSQEIVPVDAGVLYRSAFTTNWGTGFKTQFTVGYSAPYAVYVHEDLNMKHRPGKTAKFLEIPLNDPRVRKYMFTLIYRAQK